MSLSISIEEVFFYLFVGWIAWYFGWHRRDHSVQSGVPQQDDEQHQQRVRAARQEHLLKLQKLQRKQQSKKGKRVLGKENAKRKAYQTTKTAPETTKLSADSNLSRSTVTAEHPEKKSPLENDQTNSMTLTLSNIATNKNDSIMSANNNENNKNNLISESLSPVVARSPPASIPPTPVPAPATIRHVSMEKNKDVVPMNSKNPAAEDLSPKKKKKKSTIPIQQVVANTLSSVTQRPVHILLQNQDGSTLTFQPKQRANDTTFKTDTIYTLEWNQLDDSDMENLLFFKPLPLPPTLIQILGWYNRAVATKQKHTPLSINNDQDAIRIYQSSLELFINHCVKQTHLRLQQEHENNLSDQPADQQDDDEDDLFSEFVTLQQTAKQCASGGLIDQFFYLLETASPSLGRLFIDAVLTPTLATFCLDKLLHRIDQYDGAKATNLSELCATRVGAVGHFLGLSKQAASAAASRFQQEVKLFVTTSQGDGDDQIETGHAMEDLSWFRPVFQLAAHSVPVAGSERHDSIQDSSASPISSLLREGLTKLDGFPLCIYKTDNKEYPSLVKHHQSIMHNAQKTGQTLLRMARKDVLFQWLKLIIQANDGIANLLKADLLAGDGVAALASSRPFLLGLVASLLDLCCDSIADRYYQGKERFNINYIKYGKGADDMGMTEPKLLSSSKNNKENSTKSVRSKNSNKKEPSFTGGTELFFLSCALWRISIDPAHRMEREIPSIYQKYLDQLRTEAKDNKPQQQRATPTYHSIAEKPLIGILGWKIFFDEANLIKICTKFSVLQLQWLAAAQQQQDDAYLVIPGWICRQACHWLTHASGTGIPSSRWIAPNQAEWTIRSVVKLLQVGTRGKTKFSPVVMADLVQILWSFVSASIRQEVHREKRRQARFGVNVDNSRDVNVYTSLAKDNLAVTVYTNPAVSAAICPTLADTFGTLDIVEGLDVDRDSFSKYSAKFAITDLFLRLWFHPNGRCKKSVVDMDQSRLAEFVKSITKGINIILGDACHRFTDVCRPRGIKGRATFSAMRETHFVEQQTRSCRSGFRTARAVIMLLLKLSEEPKIALALVQPKGGAISDLVTMVIHFISIMTEEDGGTHSNLSLEFAGRSSPNETSNLLLEQKKALRNRLCRSRLLAHLSFGFDASIICHQFLAILALCHQACVGAQQQPPGIVVKYLTRDDDFDHIHYQNVFERLVLMAKPTESANVDLVFLHDGYSNEDSSFVLSDKDKEQFEKAHSTMEDQMTHSQVGREDEIGYLLQQAREYSSKNKSSILQGSQLVAATTSLLSRGEKIEEEVYGSRLKEWRASSESFAADADRKKFAHCYDNIARTRGGSGKGLVKEARRCFRGLPTPHPNSAIYVCYGEERMDLCRAIITGPVDTPYALGLFVFDVFFPADYPNVPPLVTFMTTGGGSTRFNPNLYSDGKVCLSLLGTFYSGNESQKWNPGYSSLAQVLLSIQTQLLVEEPYFNEETFASIRGTQRGREASREYNMTIRLATLRHAILAPLQKPTVGFEEVSKRHFEMCRKRIIVQARRWLIESKDSKLHQKFRKVYAEVVTVLESKFGSDDNNTDTGALIPRKDDIKVLKDDTEFIECLPESERPKEEDRKKQTGRLRVPTRPDELVRRLRMLAYARRSHQAHVQNQESLVLAANMSMVVAANQLNPWADPQSFENLVLSNPKHDDTDDDDDDELYN